MFLVGPASARAQLRARVNGSMAILGEYPTIAAAREAGAAAEAFLVAAPTSAKATVGEPATSDGPPALVERLTPREIEVLELLAEGLSNKGTAGRLGISDQTVKFHVATISGKLGTHTRTEAVREAVRRGLITL